MKLKITYLSNFFTFFFLINKNLTQNISFGCSNVWQSSRTQMLVKLLKNGSSIKARLLWSVTNLPPFMRVWAMVVLSKGPHRVNGQKVFQWMTPKIQWPLHSSEYSKIDGENQKVQRPTTAVHSELQWQTSPSPHPPVKN